MYKFFQVVILLIIKIYFLALKFKDIVTGFLNDDYQEHLIFRLNSASLLVPSYFFPEKPQSKMVYFIRNEIPTNLTIENMDNVKNIIKNIV